MKILIRLHICAGWFESSLGTHPKIHFLTSQLKWPYFITFWGLSPHFGIWSLKPCVVSNFRNPGCFVIELVRNVNWMKLMCCIKEWQLASVISLIKQVRFTASWCVSKLMQLLIPPHPLWRERGWGAAWWDYPSPPPPPPLPPPPTPPPPEIRN